MKQDAFNFFQFLKISNDYITNIIIKQSKKDNIKMSTHESPQQVGDINYQLRNFINLLQTSNPAAYKSIKSSGRLSVILSASQPQSSSIDKQNSIQSANLSIKNSQFQTLQTSSIISQSIKQLQCTGLTKQQQKILYQLTVQVDDLIKKKQHADSRLFVMDEQLSRQKKGTDQLLEALVKLDQEQRDVWQTYYQLSDKFKEKSTQCESIVKQNLELKEQVEIYKKELKFVKNLVYVANQNYQQLEESYNTLIKKTHQQTRNSLITKPLLILREKRSETNLITERSDQPNHHKSTYSPHPDRQKTKNISPQLNLSSSCSPVTKTSRSLKSRKSISPLSKDKENIECNFKDVYRKMMMKNLKAKKKKIET